MKKLATFALVTTLATSAFAHSPVESTSPENGVTVSAVPSQLSFSFADDIRLTRVDMTHQDHPPVRLDLGTHKSFDRVFSLPFEGMGQGAYRIEWRGLGADGHGMQGEFSFTVE